VAWEQHKRRVGGGGAESLTVGQPIGDEPVQLGPALDRAELAEVEAAVIKGDDD
jgi:hypothetical protein